MPLSEMLDSGVYAVVVLLGAIGLLLGLLRGFSRQTVKIVTVIAAFFISLAIFKRAYPYIILNFEEKTLLEVADMLGLNFPENVNSYLTVIGGEDAAYVMALPLTIVIIPALFLVTLFLVTAILHIPYVIVCGALGFTKQANGPIRRLLGGALGALQGIFIAALIIMPVAGIVDIANEAVTVAEADHPGLKNTEQISDLYHKNIDKVAQNPVLKLVDSTFGFIYDDFTTIDVEGEKIHIVTVVDDAVELYVYYGELGGGEKFDYKNPTPNDRLVIDDMINSIGDDRLMTVLVADVFKAFGSSTESGAFVLGIDEPLKTLMTELLITFSTSDEETIEGDLHTFADVYYLMATEGVFQSDDINIMFTAFLNLDENGTSAFNRLCALLETNDRYEHMSPILSNIAMDMLLQNSGVDQDTKETLDDVKNTVNDVLKIEKEDFGTAEEYKEAVNNEVSTTLTNNGIELEPDQIEQLTDYLIQQKEEKGKLEFTDADMADFMAQYYDIYSKGSSGGIGGEPILPPDFEIPGESE